MKTIIINSVPTLISLLAVIFFYKKLQPKWLQLFFYFLLYTLVTEIGAVLYSQYLRKSNHFIINIYLLINFSFYLLIFFKTFEKKSLKSFIRIAFILFILFYSFNILFIEGFYFFNIYSFCLGSIIIVSCSLLYFMELFSSDRIINYFTLPMFWISTGLLFFYVGNLLQISLLRYIINNRLDPDGRMYNFIMVTLNIILYGAFTLSFLCNQVWKKAR